MTKYVIQVTTKFTTLRNASSSTLATFSSKSSVRSSSVKPYCASSGTSLSFSCAHSGDLALGPAQAFEDVKKSRSKYVIQEVTTKYYSTLVLRSSV